MAAPIARQLAALIANLREELHIEVKGWLDLSGNDGKATLAKALIAIANHGGGFVVLGFSESQDKTLTPALIRPSSLLMYSQDGINSIVQAYATPPFHCSVDFVARPGTRELFPIISVPSHGQVPIQAKRGSPDQRTLIAGKYYIRRQGPQSAEPITDQEWRALVMRCVQAGREELLSAMRGILTGTIVVPETEAPDVSAKRRLAEWTSTSLKRWQSQTSTLSKESKARLPRGFWHVSYILMGDFVQPTMTNLRDLLQRATSRHTGWPPWWEVGHASVGSAAINHGALECFHGTDASSPDTSDFWRVSPDGQAFLIRGYQEDSLRGGPPQHTFDLTLPVWRVGECLLQARNFSGLLSDTTLHILFQVTYTGLAERRLTSSVLQRGPIGERHISKEDSIQRVIEVPVDAISKNLPEVVHFLLTPVYELFAFYKLNIQVVTDELSRMQASTY